MAISVKPWIIEGSKFTYEPGRSGGFPVLFFVQGLDPTNGLNPALACRATDASTGFTIPIYGSQVIRGFYAGRYSAWPHPANSRTSCMVEVTCLPPELMPGGAVKVEILGSNGRVTKARWAFGPQKGQPILVGYSPLGYSFQAQIDPSDAASWAAQPGQNGRFTSLATLNVQSPNEVLRFSWRQFGSPRAASKLYRRATNKSQWQRDPAGSWLCTQYDGVNVVQGDFVGPNMFDVTASFERDASGDNWAQYAIYRDGLTGMVPQDIKIDGNYNGYTIAVPYGQAEFNNIRAGTLPLPIA